MGNDGDHRNLAAAWGGERGSRKTREMGSNVGVCVRELGVGVCASWVGPRVVFVVGGCVPSHRSVACFFQGRGRPLDTLGYFLCRLLSGSRRQRKWPLGHSR